MPVGYERQRYQKVKKKRNFQKPVMRTIRMTIKQDQLLREYSAFLTEETGTEVPVSWVIETMLQLGDRKFREIFIIDN